MRPAERDAAYLWDMADAARRVVRLVQGMDYDSFAADERTTLAVERLLENIGEAASHVSKARRDQLSVIPWVQSSASGTSWRTSTGPSTSGAYGKAPRKACGSSLCTSRTTSIRKVSGTSDAPRLTPCIDTR
jgi:hypothetical protein